MQIPLITTDCFAQGTVLAFSYGDTVYSMSFCAEYGSTRRNYSVTLGHGRVTPPPPLGAAVCVVCAPRPNTMELNVFIVVYCIN